MRSSGTRVLLRLVRGRALGLAQALRHATQDPAAHRRILVEEAEERARAEDEQLHVRVGGDRRHARTLVEQRQLPEERPGTDRAQLAAVAPTRGCGAPDTPELGAGM